MLPDFRRIFALHGLTETQWRVMRVMWGGEGRSLGTISQRALVEPSVLGGVIDRLERDGLVRRRRSEADRRKVHIFLTDKGKRLEAEVTPLVEETYSSLSNRLTPEEWSSLYAAFDRLLAGSADPGTRFG